METFVQYLFFVRVPLLGLVLFVAAGFLLPREFEYLVVVRRPALLLSAALATSVPLLCGLNGLVIWNNAPHLYHGLEEIKLPAWLAEHRAGLGPFSVLAVPWLWRLWRGSPGRSLTSLLLIGVGVFVPLLVLVTYQDVLDRALGGLPQRTLGSEIGGAVVFGAVSVAVVYGAARALLHPSRRRLGLPPLAYFFILVLLVVGTLSTATMYLDKFRVPVVSCLVAWVLGVHLLSLDSGHYFPIFPLAERSGNLAIAAKAVQDSEVRASGSIGSTGKPLIVVCAAGGGAWASAWTARCLTGLHEEIGPSFTRSIGLVSGVSGGAVGAMFFLEAWYSALLEGGELDSESVLSAACSESLWAVGWGWIFSDLPAFFLLGPPRSLRAHDRGWALEEAWRRAGAPSERGQNFSGEGQSGRRERMLSDWATAAAAGWFPAVAFNATLVERGERCVFSNYGVSAISRAHSFESLYPQADIDVVTAARLSATFPYVTPIAAARIASSHGASSNVPTWHFADGGYMDNSGLLTAAEWLASLSRQEDCDQRVVLLEIRAYESGGGGPPPASRVSQALGPLKALDTIRVVSQEEQQRNAIGEIQKAFSPEHLILAPGREAPLSWDLSEADLVAESWAEVRADPRVEGLRGLFEGG